MSNVLIDNIKSGESWQVLFYALLESAEKNSWVDIDEHVSVKMRQWDGGDLYDNDHGKMFGSPYVLCCEDEEEFTAEATTILLEKYVKYIESLPKPVQTVDEITCWAQAKPFYEALDDCPRIVRAVYENCYWGHYYGDYGFTALMDNDWNYGLPRELAYELWVIAFWYCAEGCMEEVA